MHEAAHVVARIPPHRLASCAKFLVVVIAHHA